MHRSIKQIFIGNILEAFHYSYESLPQEEKDFWTKYDAYDNNRALLYGGDNKVIVTPTAINEEQLDFLAHLAEWKNVKNIFPKNYSKSICRDLMKDKDLNKKFVELLRNNPNVELIPYRHTPEFYELLAYLEENELHVSLPETIEKESKFIELYFHSKRGFRHLWEIVKDPKLKIQLPFGFITVSKEECKEAAFWFKNKGKNFVIKYNRGVQGIGVLILEERDFARDWDTFGKQIDELITDDIWLEGGIVVEERISIDKTKLGGSPNVEMRVDHEGNVHREYACEQVIQEDGKTFMGVGMNKEVDASPHIEQAYLAAEVIGKYLAGLGYRGNFDMDLVISQENKLYAIESNLRRTGGTHIHEFCKEVLGKDYSQKHYVMSYEIKLENKDKWNYDKLNVLFKPILFDKTSQTGVIVVNTELVGVGIISLLVVEKSRDTLNALVKKTYELVAML